MVISSNNAVVLFKSEVTPGIDSNPDAANDAILVENVKVSFDTNLLQTDELTGTYDPLSSVVGGTKAKIEIEVWAKGTSTPGVAPEYSPLMLAAGFAEVLTAVAVPAAAETAAAGTANTLTLGASAAATSNLYRGMPVEITSNPVAGDISQIISYSAAKVAGFGQDYTPDLDVTTDYQILPNTLWKTATEVNGTCYVFMDGLKYEFVGCVGNLDVDAPSGGLTKFTFKLEGLLGATPKSDAEVPAATYDLDANGRFMRPETWTSGKIHIDNVARGLSNFKIATNNEIDFIDNPAKDQGYDAPHITRRKVGGDIDPNEVLVDTQDLFNMMLDSQLFPIVISIGQTVGNRIMICVPEAQATNFDPTDKNRTATSGIPFLGTGPEQGIFIAIY